MKRFSIFTPGRHTAMSGATLEFSEATLRAAVAAYDPALHEAPIVVGHPKDNHPAFGWVKALHFNEETGEVEVDPDQVDEAFAELVEKGRYKKRSASWYLPDSPNNPKPGTLYLRHVGFLGAMPPAVKGLKDVQFSEDDGAVTVEFADRWTWGSLASLFKNWREYLIDTKDIETADRVAPSYLIADLEREAHKPDIDNLPASPAFSEDDDTMKLEEALQRITALETENTTLKQQAAQVSDFAERETSLKAREEAIAAREQAAARTAVAGRIDALVKAGKMLPAQKEQAVNFAMGLADGEAIIDFGEGDKAEKITQREAYLRQLEAAPKIVDYSEHSGEDGNRATDDASPEKIAERAREIQAKSGEDGKRAISFTEAVAQATAEFSAE